MPFDPVLLEILSSKVAAAAEEMSFTLQRTGRTLYVKETADFATGLVDMTGRFFAYPRGIGVSHFMDLDCGPSIRAVPDLEPGDVIITNHPYRSEGLATHLPDLHMIRPYFHDGRIVCYGWCFIHSSDVGGRVPSSISPSNDEVFQEGLLIPPMKIVRKGAFNPDFVTLFTANCRTPDDNMGDIKAMLASLHVGAQRVADIIDQHGLAVFLECQEALQAYSAEKARAVLRRIPDGSYDFWEYLDDDLVTTIPVRIRVRMEVADGLIHLDFTGTDPQVAAAYNLATMGRRHAWLTVRLISFIYTYDKSVALNAGLYRPIRATAPLGTIVNPQFPAAVGIRQAVGGRVMDAVTGAILTALPDLVPAPSAGASVPVVLAEYDARQGKRMVQVMQLMVGGMGARRGHDGIDGRDSGISNLANNPIETVEGSTGAIIREYAIRPDSGGPGEWRGGVGLTITLEILNDGSSVLARGTERFRFPPWGAEGGGPGAPFAVVLNRGTPNEKHIGKIDVLQLNAGDTITVMTPGAGGYGDPFRRDPETVLRDVRRGFVSREKAEEQYGVVLSGKAVDHEATRALRAARPQSNQPERFTFGEERVAWEKVFEDAAVGSLAQHLLSVPAVVRQERRRQVYQAAVPKIPRAGYASVVEVLADSATLRGRFVAAVEGVLAEAAAAGR